jgi:hypothetical protein
VESAELNADLLFDQVFRSDRQAVLANGGDIDAELEKVVGGPLQPGKTELDLAVERAVARALRESSLVDKLPGRSGDPWLLSKRAGEREAIRVRLAERAVAEAEEDPSLAQLAKFLVAFAAGDQSGMRTVARQLAAA